ncbi:hypothetical protein M1397_01655 [Candidatus Marsarchaeota archaeon]|nr:hypothetical protein [Candidatus Marsarchaeota archaeon]
MKDLYKSLVSAAMRKYGVPEWLSPYIYKYAKKSNIGTIKQAIGFINVRRKKGQLTKSHVILPNGIKFDIKAVLHILNQFYYGVSETGKIAEEWARDPSINNTVDISNHFREIAEARAKHARAVRNMIEGLGGAIGEPAADIRKIFTDVRRIDDPVERLLATDIIIRDAYSRPFGFIFYKVFYPVSPEFMRSLGKLFVSENSTAAFSEGLIAEKLKKGEIDSGKIMDTSRGLLWLIYKSIEAELPLAKKVGIEPEAMLLRDISIAYPLHTLQSIGIDIDIDKEMKRIAKFEKENK